MWYSKWTKQDYQISVEGWFWYESHWRYKWIQCENRQIQKVCGHFKKLNWTNRNRQWQDISHERQVFYGASNRAGCREIFWFMGWIIISNLYTLIFIFENNELFINTIVISILAMEWWVNQWKLLDSAYVGWKKGLKSIKKTMMKK